jgi:hypothetical protein
MIRYKTPIAFLAWQNDSKWNFASFLSCQNEILFTFYFKMICNKMLIPLLFYRTEFGMFSVSTDKIPDERLSVLSRFIFREINFRQNETLYLRRWYVIFPHSTLQLLPDRRGGRPESSLSLPTWGGDPLPTSGSGEGDVITPAFRGMSGTTVMSLLRGTGGF